MAIIDCDDIIIAPHINGTKITIAGRNFVLSPIDSIKFGNRISSCAVKNHRIPNAEFEAIESIDIKPYGESGTALLRFDSGHGPLHFVISAHWLRALSAAADAALEFAQKGGTA